MSHPSLEAPSSRIQPQDKLETSPIFVGGAGRSGTSLLRSILNAHSQVAIGPELKITPYVAQCWQKCRVHSANLKSGFGVGPEDVNAAFGTLIRSLLEKFRRKTEATRVGEKTPNNVFYFEHLHHIFPRSPMLHVLRDGRDVVRSLLEQDWANPDTGEPLSIVSSAESAVKYWLKAVHCGLDAEHELKNQEGRVLTVRYERLVTGPEPVIRKICAFVGVDWEPELVRFHEVGDDPYHPSTRRPISDSSVGRWKDELGAEEKEVIKEHAGDVLIELGYARDQDW